MLTLYHFEQCPYCEKVRFALDHLGIEWEGVEIDPGDRSAVKKISGQPLVPVLDDDGTVVADSTRILAHVAEKHDMSLLPPDDRDQGMAAMTEDWADEVLAQVLRRWRASRDEASRHALDVALQTLDQILHDRSYLVGDSLSYADLSAYAFIVSLSEDERSQFMDPYVNLKDWFMNMADFREKSRAVKSGYATGEF